MDPTKPILDLYSDSFTSYRERPSNYKNSQVSAYNNYQYQQSNSRSRQVSNMPPTNYKKQPSFQNLQQKYQQLYQAYKQKTSRLQSFQNDHQNLINENVRLKEQLQRTRHKNQELNALLLGKNEELEEVYRKLQEKLVNGGGGGRAGADGALEKLEDGLREAITSNYQILREAAIAEIKQIIR